MIHLLKFILKLRGMEVLELDRKLMIIYSAGLILQIKRRAWMDLVIFPWLLSKIVGKNTVFNRNFLHSGVAF